MTARARWPRLGYFTIVAAVALTVGTTALGRAAHINVNPGTVLNTATAILPTAQVRDLFPEAAGTNVNGLVADYNNGGGFTVNAGPTWTADAAIDVSPGSGSAIRAAGTTQRAALFPFLDHSSTGALRVTNVNASSDVGPMLYSTLTAGTPNGVYSNLYGWSATSATFTIWDMATGTNCPGSAGTVSFTSGTTTFDLTISYDDATGILTATITPLGQATTTRSCAYTPAAGRTAAGFMSYTSSPARYSNLLFSYA